MADLTVNGIINTGFAKGFKNALAIAVNAILWVLTIWIPYINVGTTIGMFAGLAAKASRDEQISYTEIFNPAYRRQMGEFFLCAGFMYIGTVVGFLMFIIPGYVIAIAWSLSLYLVVDKGMNPIEAISKSNNVTYGNKWTIFGGMFVLSLIVFIVIAVVGWILSKIAVFLSVIVVIVLLLIAASIFTCAWGYIYGSLTKE
jgi:uncharacterized membrane protein